MNRSYIIVQEDDTALINKHWDPLIKHFAIHHNPLIKHDPSLQSTGIR